jgi:hypothetical protein
LGTVYHKYYSKDIENWQTPHTQNFLSQKHKRKFLIMTQCKNLNQDLLKINCGKIHIKFNHLLLCNRFPEHFLLEKLKFCLHQKTLPYFSFQFISFKSQIFVFLPADYFSYLTQVKSNSKAIVIFLWIAYFIWYKSLRLTQVICLNFLPL